MARTAKIPDRELEICRRLRECREGMKIARTVFATAVGIGNQRLESYESGRVPLPYKVYKAINEKYFVNPKWLVTGQGVIFLGGPTDDREIAEQVGSRELLSSVYDRFSKWKIGVANDYVEHLCFGSGGVIPTLEAITLGLVGSGTQQLFTDELLSRFLSGLQHATIAFEEAVGIYREKKRSVRRAREQSMSPAPNPCIRRQSRSKSTKGTDLA